MGRIRLRPHILLQPIPVALITTADAAGKGNVCTATWVGVACSVPPMLSVAIRPERYTHGLLQASGEFAVNIATTEMTWAVEYVGSRSGRDEDKFAGSGLTALPASEIKAPLIAECPIGIECRVRQQIKLGSHDLFLGEILAIQVDEVVVDAKGRLVTDKVKPLALVTPYEYWSLGQRIQPPERKPRMYALSGSGECAEAKGWVEAHLGPAIYIEVDKLDEAERENAMIELAQHADPVVFPVLFYRGQVVVGYKPEEYAKLKG